MPDQPVEEAERRRLASYTLLLWLAREKQAFVEEADAFIAAQERSPVLPTSLHAITDGWLGYVVRDLLAVCHEAVFDAVMREVEGVTEARKSPALACEVVAALVQGTREKDEALRELKILKKGESITTFSFEIVHERIKPACSNQLEVSNGLRRWNGGLNETVLYKLAQTSREAAIALLPVAWSLVAQRIDPKSETTPLQRDILHVGDIYQIGIFEVVLPKVAEFIEQKRSFLEVTAEHLRVAWTAFLRLVERMFPCSRPTRKHGLAARNFGRVAPHRDCGRR